jgi:hypothetical protein
VQRSLNAAFQDLLRLGGVGHGPRELERAHHEAEDGRRAATFRYGISVRKQSGQRRHEASQRFFVVLPGGQGLAGDFREQRRRGAPACRVFEVSAVQVPPDRVLEVQTSPLIFIEAMLLVGERASYRLTNELFLALEMRRECPFGQAGLTHDPGDAGGGGAVSAQALRRDIDYVPSRRCLMTLLKTHRAVLQPMS